MYRTPLTEAHFAAQDDMEVRETTVGGLLREAAATHPDAPALLEVTAAGETGRAWSYAELLADAETLARALSTRFAPGERVAVWAPNTPEWLLLEYGAALAGLGLVTANPAYQARELQYVLRQSRAAGLFCVAEHRGNPMARIAREAAEGLEGLREIVDMEDPAQFLARGDRPETLPRVTPDDEAQVQYTSGTTGFPKGARLHHRGLTNNARFFAARAGIRAGDVWGCYMPMFHTSGCGMIALGALQNRGRVLMFRVFDPAAVLRLTEAERINAFTGVPTMMVAMLEAQAAAPRDCSSARIAISGGSMVAPELVRKVTRTFGCGFQIVYGQTETSPVVCQHHLGDALEDIAGSVGQPLPRTEISIRRTEDNATAAFDETGEICVRGYCTMLGYNDDPDATSRTVDAEGWLHTGDLGAMDARGYVRVTGRVKEMIIRGGENLFPAEIENALLEHPDVAEVAVVGLPDERWGEIVACFARPAPGARIDPEALRRHCRERLAAHKTPAVWAEVEGFPMTGSGKVRKFALRDTFLAGEIAPL